MDKPKCDHQYYDSGEESRKPNIHAPFNYCPWCGSKLRVPVELEDDDCQKGGCAD